MHAYWDQFLQYRHWLAFRTWSINACLTKISILFRRVFDLHVTIFVVVVCSLLFFCFGDSRFVMFFILLVLYYLFLSSMFQKLTVCCWYSSDSFFLSFFPPTFYYSGLSWCCVKESGVRGNLRFYAYCFFSSQQCGLHVWKQSSGVFRRFCWRVKLKSEPCLCKRTG